MGPGHLQQEEDIPVLLPKMVQPAPISGVDNSQQEESEHLFNLNGHKHLQRMRKIKICGQLSFPRSSEVNSRDPIYWVLGTSSKKKTFRSSFQRWSSLPPKMVQPAPKDGPACPQRWSSLPPKMVQPVPISGVDNSQQEESEHLFNLNGNA